MRELITFSVFMSTFICLVFDISTMLGASGKNVKELEGNIGYNIYVYSFIDYFVYVLISLVIVALLGQGGMRSFNAQIVNVGWVMFLCYWVIRLITSVITAFIDTKIAKHFISKNAKRTFSKESLDKAKEDIDNKID